MIVGVIERRGLVETDLEIDPTRNPEIDLAKDREIGTDPETGLAKDRGTGPEIGKDIGTDPGPEIETDLVIEETDIVKIIGPAVTAV